MMQGAEAGETVLVIWFVGLLVIRYRRRKKLNLPFWTRKERIALIIWLVAPLAVALLVWNLNAGRLGRAAADTLIVVGIPYLMITGSRDKRRLAGVGSESGRG